MDNGRWFKPIVIATLFAIVGTLTSPVTTSAEELHFYIGSSIADDDAMYIREGVRLGQDYVRERIGTEVETPTIVNAVPAEPRTGADLVGLSTSHALVVFTGSEGWVETPPFDRVHVVVHEYMHVVQQELAGERLGAPLWLDEGIAEYVGFHAVIEAGLVSEQDVEDYNALQVLFSDPLPPLSELENPADFQSQSASVYGLAYLAVNRLIGERPEAIERYYTRIADGTNWRAAFQSAFRINPRTFYQQFEASRPDISAPFGFPESFTPVDEADFSAEVFLDETPETIVRGDQLLVRADSAAGAGCSLTVRTRAGRALLDQPTYADATGAVFWLWTVPIETRRAAVTASISCGGDAVTTPLTIE